MSCSCDLISLRLSTTTGVCSEHLQSTPHSSRGLAFALFDVQLALFKKLTQQGLFANNRFENRDPSRVVPAFPTIAGRFTAKRLASPRIVPSLTRLAPNYIPLPFSASMWGPRPQAEGVTSRKGP